MEKTKFLTIYATFENLEIVKVTLPSIIEETKHNDAKLIVHDSSVTGKTLKWDYLQELNRDNDFFLLLSSNLSMAHVRNMCLALGQELYAPEYICMMEDDHGFNEGFIDLALESMKKYYGVVSPNGLRYGLFTGCGKHHYAPRIVMEDGHAYPNATATPGQLGGANSCFRCAPTSHWNNVLRGYDTDEYLISTYQTNNLNLRNYNKGFTTLIVANGSKIFDLEATGRGTSTPSGLKLWDQQYTASDSRSAYLGKTQSSDKKSKKGADSKFVFTLFMRLKIFSKKIFKK